MRKALKFLSVSKRPEYKPHHEVTTSENTEYFWNSVGKDPQFHLTSNLPSPGWHFLEFAMAHGHDDVCVKLYLKTLKGFQEKNTIQFIAHSGRKQRIPVYIPMLVRGIRLDPMEVPGPFTIKDLRFIKTTPWIAKKKIFRKLAQQHYVFKNLNQDEILRKLKTEAKSSNINWQLLAVNYYVHSSRKKTGKDPYQSWIQTVEAAAIRGLLKTAANKQADSSQARISVLLPVYNPNPIFLKQCIQSVIDQSLDDWELCIADDCSTDLGIREIIDHFVALDSRIKVKYRTVNGNISAALNSALELATGDYITFLDHDDLLPKHALLRVNKAIQARPNLDFIYSDEDKIDAAGHRYQPHFKSGWNPDLLLSQNYINHLSVIRSHLLKKSGGFRSSCNGSQDHDMLLRCVINLDPANIEHIPEVLYHWRAVAGSTSLAASEKDYTTQAGLAALGDYLASSAAGATVGRGSLPNTYRVNWPVPDSQPLVSIIIPTHNGLPVVRQCVESIFKKTVYANFEVIVVSNNTDCQKTLDYLTKCARRRPNFKLVEWNHPFNYSAINNFGRQHAEGDVICLLNNDTEVISPLWLNEMVSHAMRDDIGCVGAKLYYPDNSIQHAGVFLGIGGVAGHSHKHYERKDHGYFSRLRLVQNLSAVTGACLVVRSQVFDQVGGLDEQHLAIAFNDVDLCLRVMQQGYRNLWTPYAELYHHESKTRGRDNTKAKRKRFAEETAYMQRRWGNLLQNDPYYSPNLSLKKEDLSIWL